MAISRTRRPSHERQGKWPHLKPDQQEAVLRALFDPETGACFSAMKTEIAGTDFMCAGPWYSYADDPGGVDLKSFSIARGPRR